MFSLVRFIAAATFAGCCVLAGEVRSLTILHTNDLHARISVLDNHHGGFAALATLVAHEKANCTDCIMLNAGDLVQGSPVSTMFRGMPIFEIANLLGIDAATLGNHDFDYGWRQTRRFIETAKYPVVTANIINSRGELITSAPYLIRNVNGLRVGIIGVMTDDLKNFSTVKLLEDWHTSPVVAAVRKHALELRDKTDLILVLGHITETEENAILRTLPEIPVIISGHVHGGIEKETVYQGRIMVRVKAYGEELGRLELKVDTEKKAPVSWKWQHIVVDPAVYKPNAEVARLVKHWEDEVTSEVDQPLAIAKQPIGKPAIKAMIERAMREKTGADFAYMNLSGVRDVLPQGQILVRNIWNIMPFDNMVVVGKFRGSDLPKVVLGSRKVEPEREYTLAVSDFTAANQSTPENLRVSGLKFASNGPVLRDVLLEWFREKKIIEEQTALIP
ncbi:MAG: bifunctional metallophosphatase/5'-nucleotidase [Acidobacteriota bacterium]|nr:bifunctional metallophosphatase/5'-nucleotidase [Acidobacteriota bacterium]